MSAAAVAFGVAYWGILVAPKSKRRLRDPARLAAEVLFFVLASVAFAQAGRPTFGIVFGLAAIVNAVLVRVVGTAAP